MNRMRQATCPVALHPDGAPLRIPVFEYPQSGRHLLHGLLNRDTNPQNAAAQLLFQTSGLETRAALLLGTSDQIVEHTTWHFALCRIALPVRAHWAHIAPDAPHQRRVFHWHPIEDNLPPEATSQDQAALAWIRGAL